MENTQIANELIAQGWVLLPPPGCVVLVKRPFDNEPREFCIDEIEIEIDMHFSLVQIDEQGNGEYFDPEDIVKFVSIPEDWYKPDKWWRSLREEVTRVHETKT